MKATSLTIKLNAFVKRPAADALSYHFEGSEEELLALVGANFHRAKAPKNGVMVVPVPPGRFRTAVVPVTPETPLKAECEARREGEDAFIMVKAAAPKAPARTVNIVLFHRDLLGPDATTDADYEVVSINAFTVEGPMTPLAMAKNFLCLPGGTKADYTAEEFARSIIFWAKHAVTAS